jgi:uncharacterized membrane protein
MTSEKRRRPAPAILADARRNPGFALGAFGLSAWAYIGMSHTIGDYEGELLGWTLGVAYEALVIGLAWEGRRRADLAHENGRAVTGHKRWLGGAIAVGVLSGALAAWHGWTLGEGVFAISRAVAPVLAAVAVHLFFQSAASAREAERRAQLKADQEQRAAQIHAAQQSAVLDMLDAVREAQIAPDAERDERIAAVTAAVGRVHRHVPAEVTAEVTAPHLKSERIIHDVIQEAAMLAGEWMPREPFANGSAAPDAAPVDAFANSGAAPVEPFANGEVEPFANSGAAPAGAFANADAAPAAPESGAANGAGVSEETKAEIRNLRAKRVPVREVAALLGISVSTVSKYGRPATGELSVIPQEANA